MLTMMLFFQKRWSLMGLISLCCGTPTEHLREELEGLFNDYVVDVVFSGHVHSYARTCNVLRERCVVRPLRGRVPNCLLVPSHPFQKNIAWRAVTGSMPLIEARALPASCGLSGQVVRCL